MDTAQQCILSQGKMVEHSAVQSHRTHLCIKLGNTPRCSCTFADLLLGLSHWSLYSRQLVESKNDTMYQGSWRPTIQYFKFKDSTIHLCFIYIFNLLFSWSIISPGKIFCSTDCLKRNLQIPFDLSLGVQGVPLLRDSSHSCCQRHSTWTQGIAAQVSTVTLLVSLGGKQEGSLWDSRLWQHSAVSIMCNCFWA